MFFFKETNIRLPIYSKFRYPKHICKDKVKNDQALLQFQAVSDTAESNVLDVEVACDGKWVEGSTEMSNHCIVKEENLSLK